MRPRDRALSISPRLGSGLRDRLREGYSLADFRSDAVAGVVVGLIALPLSMALAIASGVPPQHGLYTAIVAGLAVPLIGGARHQITGPTAAFVALLVPIVHAHGLGGLLLAGFLAGLIQIGMGLARLGRLIEFVPHPVTTGFTAGIAVVIASIQLKDFLGLAPASSPADFGDRLVAYWHARGGVSLDDAVIGGATLVVLLAAPRLTRRVPASLIALVLAAGAAAGLAHWLNVDVATIGSRFSSTVHGATVRGIPPLPPAPALPWSHGGPGGAPLGVDFALIQALLPSAFAIAMLGSIESLLSAVIADAATGHRHDPNAELIGLGVGNVLCPFFGGIPATAALARTAANIRAGGISPLSSIVHALFVLACTIALAPLVSYLPMAALAALLLVVAWNMSEARHFTRLLRAAPRSDVIVLLSCFGLTIAFDMVIAVGVGVVLAALLFMKRMAEITNMRLDPDTPRDLDLPAGVEIYEVAGPLFFGAAQRALRALEPQPETFAVILDMHAVPVIDATGLVALESAMRQLDRLRCKIIFAGLADLPRETLTRAGVVRSRGKVAFAPDVDTALSIALVHRAARVAA